MISDRTTQKTGIRIIEINMKWVTNRNGIVLWDLDEKKVLNNPGEQIWYQSLVKKKKDMLNV